MVFRFLFAEICRQHMSRGVCGCRRRWRFQLRFGLRGRCPGKAPRCIQDDERYSGSWIRRIRTVYARFDAGIYGQVPITHLFFAFFVLSINNICNSVALASYLLLKKWMLHVTINACQTTTNLQMKIETASRSRDINWSYSAEINCPFSGLVFQGRVCAETRLHGEVGSSRPAETGALARSERTARRTDQTGCAEGWFLRQQPHGVASFGALWRPTGFVQFPSGFASNCYRW